MSQSLRLPRGVTEPKARAARWLEVPPVWMLGKWMLARWLVPALALSVAGCATRPMPTGPSAPVAVSVPGSETAALLRVINNHPEAYRGPIEFRTGLPGGMYQGDGATGEVHAGVARVVVALPGTSEVSLTRRAALGAHACRDGTFSVVPGAEKLDMRWRNRSLGSMEFDLIVLPDTTSGVDDAVRSFRALPIAWTPQQDGTLLGEARRSGFALRLTAMPYGGGWLDMRAHLSQADDTTGPAYVALVRRVTAPGLSGPHLRFNGRAFGGGDSPLVWDRDFWYTHGVDWISWNASDSVSMMAVSGFTPTPTIQRNGVWAEASHFWVWERTRRTDDQLYLVSEIAGANPAKEKYMRATPYAPMRRGDVVDLRWRLAVAQNRTKDWEESQLGVFAGRRATTESNGAVVEELGVGSVSFGISYFPYSTFTENFDYYRTPGLSQESYWPISAQMWTNWRMFAPRVQTDLHIIRAMGFDMVRMHHLELLQRMDRAEALAFLDFYTGEARRLGLHILVDTEGPTEWVSLIANRYRDIVTRFEIENEILIGGIKPGDSARWTALYHAAKRGDPGAQVFFTGAANNGMFERLRDLGVPFDRVGLHAYKHGPQWEEAFSSNVLGTAGYASDIGRDVTLGEFNWKELTKLAPEARLREFGTIYRDVLEPRQIPEVFQFQFHESLAFNPAIGGSFTRHYETLGLDRRPKPEAFETMRFIRKYGRADAPVLEVPIAISETYFENGSAVAHFTVANHTSRPLTLGLSAMTFDSLESHVTSPTSFVLVPGGVREGDAELRLTGSHRPGTYHHFIRVAYGGKTAYGWGVASNPGVPQFDKDPVLTGRVTYPDGAGAAVVNRIAWKRPLGVAFGANASVIELEMAYTVRNTLQSATGRPVWISSVGDVPDSLLRRGALILIGTSASNALIGSVTRPQDIAGKGTVLLSESNGRQWLLLTGADKQDVEAAAIDLVLRYWKNAKDATIRITGMERGAALGNRIGGKNADLP